MSEQISHFMMALGRIEGFDALVADLQSKRTDLLILNA